MTHLALDGLLYYSEVKYIVVGRDARDVGMSLWDHYRNFTPEHYALTNNYPDRVGDPLPVCPQDIHVFWRDWIKRGWFVWQSEGYPLWGNLHHTQSWWQSRHLKNILFVHYNDLLTNLPGEIQRVADFLNIALPIAALPAMLEALTLDSMRSAAEKINPNAKVFFFKGTNGRWKDVLTESEVAMYEEKAAKVLTPDCKAWLEQGRVALA
jgi:aryl sulfotransferase